MAIGEYLTTAEVAKALKVTPMRVHQFRKENRLAGHLIGTVLLFHRNDVADFKAKKRRPGRPPANSKKGD